MLAAYAAKTDPHDPLSGLAVGQQPVPTAPPGWVPVKVVAAALNHHDLWSLRGVGLPADRLPMILGCDAAGVDPDGNEVIVHAVIGSPDRFGDETLDPARSLLSEKYAGTLAETVWVPGRNLVPKPAELSWHAAACLPTSWLTAYRMLFTQARLRPGQTVLVQGAGGGVSTALVALGARAGLRVWVTSRSADRAQRAVGLGASAAFESGERLPERVDAVMESVGAATWSHSLKSLRPGGALVLCGTTSGAEPEHAELARVFFTGLRILGTTMGTRAELASVAAVVAETGLTPTVDRVVDLAEVGTGLAAMAAGETFGKVVVDVTQR